MQQHRKGTASTLCFSMHTQAMCPSVEGTDFTHRNMNSRPLIGISHCGTLGGLNPRRIKLSYRRNLTCSNHYSFSNHKVLKDA